MRQYTLDDLHFEPVTDPGAPHQICMKCGQAKPIDHSHAAVLEHHVFFVCSDTCLEDIQKPDDRWYVDQHISNAIAADKKSTSFVPEDPEAGFAKVKEEKRKRHKAAVETKKVKSGTKPTRTKNKNVT